MVCTHLLSSLHQSLIILYLSFIICIAHGKSKTSEMLECSGPCNSSPVILVSSAFFRLEANFFSAVVTMIILIIAATI